MSHTHYEDRYDQYLREVEAKIVDLQRLALELRSIRASCTGNRSMTECKIIAALSQADRDYSLNSPVWKPTAG